MCIRDRYKARPVKAPQASQARPVLRTRTPLSLRDISPRSGESPHCVRSLLRGQSPREKPPLSGEVAAKQAGRVQPVDGGIAKSRAGHARPATLLCPRQRAEPFRPASRPPPLKGEASLAGFARVKGSSRSGVTPRCAGRCREATEGFGSEGLAEPARPEGL